MQSPFVFILPLMCLLSCSQPQDNQEQTPNILFILSDDHTSQAWGVYGSILDSYAKNDNIKRLVKDGILLKNAFCTNSICVPSRASIMTGQYSHMNGVFELEDALHPDSNNVAKALQSVGYETALFGKWHLKEEPTGFDDYTVLPGQGRYNDPLMIRKGDWDKEDRAKVHEGFTADVITDHSLNWLKNRSAEKPFFLCTHFKATHEPFDYPERYDHFLADQELPYPTTLLDFGKESSGRTHDGWPLEILGKRFEDGTGKRYPGTSFSLDGLDSINTRKKIYQKFSKDFLRSGAAIDDNIGRLIDYLKSTGQYENTVIIYTADQGYFLGEHGFFDKRFIYEESLRMPFVITYPKELEGGKQIDDIILNIDFPALLLDFANAKDAMPNIQGRSFRENLKGNTPPDWRKSMYYRYWTNQPERPAHLGIRTERYKLALFYGQSRKSARPDAMPYLPGWEFYDLQKDPQEAFNAIGDLSYQEIIEELKIELKELKDTLGDDDEKYPFVYKLIQENWN